MIAISTALFSLNSCNNSESNHLGKSKGRLILSFIKVDRDTIGAINYIAADISIFASNNEIDFPPYQEKPIILDSLKATIYKDSSNSRGKKAWILNVIKPVNMDSENFIESISKVLSERELIIKYSDKEYKIDSVESNQIIENLSYQRRY